MPPAVTHLPERGWFGVLSRAVREGVVLLDSDGGLEFANPATYRVLGCRNEPELRERWAQVRATLGAALDALRAADDSSVSREVEVKIGRDVRPIRLQLFRLEEAECTGYLAMLHDRLMIEALETDLRLASRMRGLTALYQATVHDLKAPLHAMTLNLELLRQSLTGSEPSPDARAQQSAYVDIVQGELSRLSRSLQTLLAQAREQSSAAAHRFDLRRLVREIVALIEPQARGQRVAVEMRIPSESVRVCCQRDQTKQALVNLVMNALESMPDGGRLDVRLETSERAAILRVRDEGPGISPEVLERVFDMHFTTKKTGTGIGLFVARTVLAANGGEVRLDSRPGEGTLAEVRMPLAEEGPSPREGA